MKNCKDLILWLVLFLVSCNHIEVNTSDPQLSNDISTSKRNGMFIKNYYVREDTSNFIDAKEIWLEDSWKYEIVSSKKVPVKTGGKQINILVSKFNSKEFNEKNFFITWQMEAENLETFGRVNNVYMFYFKNDVVPDSLKVSLKKKMEDNSYQTVSSFVITSR